MDSVRNLEESIRMILIKPSKWLWNYNGKCSFPHMTNFTVTSQMTAIEEAVMEKKEQMKNHS